MGQGNNKGIDISSVNDHLYKNVYLIVMFYFILGSLWIYITDIIVVNISSDILSLSKLQTYKGWLYVVVTTILLFYLVNRFYNKLRNYYYKILESHKTLQLIFDNVGSIIWTVDKNLRFTSSYGSGLSNLNLKYNEVVGKTIYEYFNTQDDNYLPVASHIKVLNGSSVSFEFEWGGNIYHCNLQPLKNEAGRVESVIGVAVDITERKIMEDKIKHQLNELLQWKNVILEREEKIMELKKQVNELLIELGRPIRYSNV